MTPAHRIETILREDGKLSLDALPFRAGQAVEVIVLPAASHAASGHPLRGGRGRAWRRHIIRSASF